MNTPLPMKLLLFQETGLPDLPIYWFCDSKNQFPQTSQFAVMPHNRSLITGISK